MSEQTATEFNQTVNVTTYLSAIDGVVVVEVDTKAGGDEDERGPVGVRVYLNDHAIYENPRLPQLVTVDLGRDGE